MGRPCNAWRSIFGWFVGDSGIGLIFVGIGGLRVVFIGGIGLGREKELTGSRRDTRVVTRMNAATNTLIILLAAKF